MKNLRYILFAAAVGFMAVGCEDSLMTYDAETTPANIYFTFANYDGRDGNFAVDSSAISLIKNGVAMADSVLQIPVSVMGSPVNYARSIAFESVADTTFANPAVEGRDYELLPSEIMADSIVGFVKIKLLGSDALTAQGPAGLKFKVKLVPNEHFHTNYDKLNDKSVEADSTRAKYKMNALNYKVYYNNDTEFSLLWDTQVNSSHKYLTDRFGSFSNEKIALIMSVASRNAYEDWYPTPAYVTSKAPMGGWAQYCQQYLSINTELLRALKRTLAAAEAAGSPLMYWDATTGKYEKITLGPTADGIL